MHTINTVPGSRYAYLVWFNLILRYSLLDQAREPDARLPRDGKRNG